MSLTINEQMDTLSILNNIFYSTVPHKWALVNIAGYTEQEAKELIKNRKAQLKATAKLNNKLANLENNNNI